MLCGVPDFCLLFFFFFLSLASDLQPVDIKSYVM